MTKNAVKAPTRRQQLGGAAERYSAHYVTNLGWRIVGQNWRGPGGELDIVAWDADTLVFVEVRARRGVEGSAAESVTAQKQARLIRLAYHYLAALDGPEPVWRIDVLAIDITIHGALLAVTHLRAAVEEQ